MTRKWSVVFCVDLTELHWITKRSLQSGTPNTHSINSLSTKPFYWIQTFAGIFENLQHTTLSFTLVDLLGSCQQEYQEQDKYTQTFSKQGGQSQSDKALFSNSNMCRTTQWRPYCTVLGLFLVFQWVITWKLSFWSLEDICLVNSDVRVPKCFFLGSH